MLAIAAALLVAALAGFAAFATAASKHSWPRAIKVSGRLSRPLFPGASRPLDLGLTNRAGVTLVIRRLRVLVRVDPAHHRAGCSTRRDFFVRQMPRSAFPITLPGSRRRPARRSRKLSALGLRALPWVGMRDLPYANQDACKGAKLRLRFRVRARTLGSAR